MGTFSSYQIGNKSTLTHILTEQDVNMFATLSGDTNPLHMNQGYAAKTKFKQRVVHGFLTASFISTIIGTLLPGEGALYLGQNLKFKKPVFINDTIRVTVEVIQKVKSAKIMELKTTVTNQHLEVVITGTAKVTWAE